MAARDTAGLMARAAARAADDPFFLASALAAYRQLTGMDDAALAAELGCDVAALTRLALCRRPDGASPMFKDEVPRIAAHAGADPLKLANLLRAADAAERMQTASPNALLAARDRGPDQASPDDAPAGDQPEPAP